MYRTLITDLLHYDRMQTTEPKAKGDPGAGVNWLRWPKGICIRGGCVGRVNDAKVVERCFPCWRRGSTSGQAAYYQIIRLGPSEGRQRARGHHQDS